MNFQVPKEVGIWQVVDTTNFNQVYVFQYFAGSVLHRERWHQSILDRNVIHLDPSMIINVKDCIHTETNFHMG